MDLSPLITLRAHDADVGTAVVSGDVSDDGQIRVRFSDADDLSDAFELTVDAPRLRQLLGYLLPAAAAPLSATLEQTAEPARIHLGTVGSGVSAREQGAVEAVIELVTRRSPRSRVVMTLEIDPDDTEFIAAVLADEYREGGDAAYLNTVSALYYMLPPPADSARRL